MGPQKQLSRIFVHLYRRVLTVNRQLPPEMRKMGDLYARDEFRRHRDVSDVIQAQLFITEWQSYCDTMESQLKESDTTSAEGFGKNFEDIDVLSPEQIGQLFELKQEVANPTPVDVDEDKR